MVYYIYFSVLKFLNSVSIYQSQHGFKYTISFQSINTKKQISWNKHKFKKRYIIRSHNQKLLNKISLLKRVTLITQNKVNKELKYYMGLYNLFEWKAQKTNNHKKHLHSKGHELNEFPKWLLIFDKQTNTNKTTKAEKHHNYISFNFLLRFTFVVMYINE